jgi:hypothetical protein
MQCSVALRTAPDEALWIALASATGVHGMTEKRRIILSLPVDDAQHLGAHGVRGVLDSKITPSLQNLSRLDETFNRREGVQGQVEAAMGDTIYVIHGFLGGRRQPEEVFVSEAHARLRAAQLERIYDSVSLDTRSVGREMHRDRKQRGQHSALLYS